MAPTDAFATSPRQLGYLPPPAYHDSWLSSGLSLNSRWAQPIRPKGTERRKRRFLLKTILISLDLTSLDGHYDPLFVRLSELKASPLHRALWTLTSTERSTRALEWDLRRFLVPTDKLVIVTAECDPRLELELGG